MIASKGLIKGMHQDNHPRYQPPNTYYSALNAVVESTDGDLMSISNELGNLQELTTYPINDDGVPKKIIGHRLLDDGTTVLFLFDPASTRPYHEIGIWDPFQKKYTTYVAGTCLNFSDQHYINAIYRLKNGCERIVYFTDNYNPYRVINLDRPEYYTVPPDTQLLTCTNLDYSRDYSLPDFVVQVLSAGGILKLGTYQFAYRLLDVDRNPTNWIFFTNPVSISDDSLQLLNDPDTVNNYDGGVSNPDETGYVQDTIKSVKLTIDGVNTSFSYFQLAVIKFTSSDGAVSGVDILVPQAIQPSLAATVTEDFIYTGQLSQIESSISLEELLSENLIVDKVRTHVQHENRLFIANLTESTKSYVGFQRHASTIKVEYVEAPIDVAEALSKDPNYYFSEAGFLHDEVYALGIVYVFSDGTTSPVFHIPGRSKIDNTGGTFGINPFFADYAPDWDDEVLSGDPNIYNDEKTARWQVYNTFTEYDDPYTHGLMGYYETDTTYEDIDDCSNHPDGYWGADWQGNPIEAGDPIRHHRMPPSIRSNAAAPSYIRKLGLKFTIDVNYPDNDIVGHYFVYSDRTYEKTILDKGLITPLGMGKVKLESPFPLVYGYTVASDEFHLPSSAGVIPFAARGDHALYGYVSPTTLYEEKTVAANYLSIERYHITPTIFDTDTSYSWLTAKLDNIIYSESTRVHQHEIHTVPTEVNFRLKLNQFIPTATVQYGEEEVLPTIPVPDGTIINTVQNLSVNTSLAAILLDREFPEVAAYALDAPSPTSLEQNNFFRDGNGFVVALKADISVFRNLNVITYKRIGNVLLNKEPDETFTIEQFDGDIFICPLDILDYHWWVDTDPERTKVKACFVTTPIESHLNLGLRHGDISKSLEFAYYQWPNTADAEHLFRYVVSKYYNPIIHDPTVFQFYPEPHLYNKAYSRIDSIYSYYPLSQDYDFCSECLNQYPYRIYYSDLDDIERRTDAYRRILPNNYLDIDGANGEITDMFINFKEFYLTTPFATYKIPTSQQVLTTEQDEAVFIGSGKVFQQPAYPLKTADNAFAGQVFWKSRVLTEYGAFFMDTESKRPILISDSLKDISLEGMRNFFQNNSRVQFLDQFKLLTGQPYTNLSTVSDSGVGYMSTYDPRHKRLIVYKKDYTLTNSAAQQLQIYPPGYFDFPEEEEPPYYPPTSLWTDGTNFYTYFTPVAIGDPNYFENRSFTLSYSFLTNSWVSYHSYFPYYMFFDNNTFYSDNIYTHGAGPFQTFYGIKYDHFLDVIIPLDLNERKTFSAFNYVSDTWAYSSTSESFTKTYETFTKAVFYNSDQSSGYNDIVANPSPFQTVSIPSIAAEQVDSKWRINDPRDYTISNADPIWDNAPFIPNALSWTDRAPNQNNISYSKSLFSLPRFKDYYQGVRLYFNSASNLKITTDLIQTLYTNKNR